MKHYKKSISKLLLLTMFLNSTICCPIQAEPLLENNNITENLFDSENTEDSLETTTINMVDDNVESPSGVVVDIISGIKDIFNNEDTENIDLIVSDDTVLSDSALDFQLDTSEMTDEVIDLVNSKEAYSKLSQYEKYMLMEQVGIREDTMIECGEAAYSILDSIPKALIMQRMCFSLDDSLKMIQSHKSETAALEETKKYVLKSYECPFMNDEEIFGNLSVLLRDGYTTEEVLNAFVVSKVLNTDVSEIIKKNNDSETVSENSETVSMEDMADDNEVYLADLADKYSIDAEAVENYISSDDADLYDLEAEFERTAGILGVSEEKVKQSAVSAASSDSNDISDLRFDTTYNTGPINIADTQMNVSKGIGSLHGSKEICNIPGVNGLDFKLDLNYSSTVNKYNYIEDRFSVGNNWFLSFPYVIDKKGDSIFQYNANSDKYKDIYPVYIVLGNGESYYLSGYQTFSDGSFRYRAQLCYNDELYLYSDINSTFGNSTDSDMQSKFKLRHKDGKYDYFNRKGQWLGKTDKFGNTIKLIKESAKKYKIIVTNKSSVTIDIDSRKVTSITMPDNKVFYINYSTQNIESKVRKVISSYKDGENNTTTFEYQFLKDGKDYAPSYENALITKMKLQSGMEYRYTYELADVAKYYSGTDTGEDYTRVTSESVYYDNVVYNQKQFTYSNHNYTDANAIPPIECLCPTSDNSSHCDCYIRYNLNDIGEEIVLDFCVFYLDDSNGWKCSYCGNCSYNTHIDDNFTYTMTEKENNGVSTTYTFDVFDRLIKVASTDKTIKYTYNDTDMYAVPNPKTITTVENGTTKVEEFSYNRVGDICSYVVKNNGKELHKEYHSYDYDGSNVRYDLETMAEYFINGTEKITVTNQLSNYNKTIGSTKITNNKNEILAYTEFTYNTYTEGGQLSVKKEFLNYDPNKNEYFNPHRYTRYSYSDKTYGIGTLEAAPILVETYIKEYDEHDESFKTEYAYDNMGRMTEQKNANSITRYEYNGVGDIIKESYSDKYGGKTVSKTYTYNYTGNTCTIKDENGNSILYDFDSAGKLVKVSQGSNTLAEYTYNNRMQPAKFTEGKSVTAYTYDNKDRLISQVVNEGTKVLSNKTYTYENNSTGLKTTEKINGDSSSATITNITQADVLGRCTMVNDAGNVTYYTYDMLDNVIKSKIYICTKSDRTVYLTMDYTYDGMGNVLSTTRTDDIDTANAKKTYATYDMLGRMITSTDSKGNTTEYTYNALDLLTNKKAPFAVDNNGNMVYTNYGYTYDSVGNVISDTVTAGVTNEYTYDYRNRVTEAKTGDQVINYAYDSVGNMTEYRIGYSGRIHKYAYDSLNRVTKYTDALGNSETYTYDSNQDMVTKVDRRGKTINYTYDGLHRILTERVDGIYNMWTYGLTGGVLTERSNVATKSYTYNSYGLPSSESTCITDSDTFKINRFYDTRGNNTQEHYYKNGTLYEKRKYYYNNKNKMSGLDIAEGDGDTFTRKVTYYYDKHDNLASAHFGNNTYDVYYYNAANLVTCMDMVDKSDKTKLEHLVYNYRLDGNISSKKETYNGDTNTTAYTYDSTGRLTRESVTGDSDFIMAYTYDDAGNRTSMTVSGGVTGYTENYSYDKNNRLISSVLNKGSTSETTSYTYDKNGNQTRINGSYIQSFSYDGLNRLMDYDTSKGEGVYTEYTYMADGYRLSKTVGGKETRYLWDNGNVVAEMDYKNDIERKYYRGLNLVCDQYDNYYMHDPHGNVIEVYDSLTGTEYADNVLWYNAFGTSKYFHYSDKLLGTRQWGYCDQQYDWESGNYYMRARYYNPDTGRFISEDSHWNPSNMIYGDRTFKAGEVKYPDITASLQAGNLYGYCMGNPIRYVDENGNISFAAGVIGAAVVSCIVSGVTTGVTYVSKNKKFGAGFINGFVSCAGTEIGAAIGTVTGSTVGIYAGTIIGSTIGSALGSVTEDLVYNSEKNSTEIAKSAAKSASIGIVSGISSSYFKYAIEVANTGTSAAKTLMVYDENFGRAIEIFFNELITILSAQ